MTQRNKQLLSRTFTITEIIIVLFVPIFLVLLTSGLILTRHTYAERPSVERAVSDIEALARENMSTQSHQYDILFDGENADALAELKTYDTL